MKRRLTKLVVFLLLGAVVNVGVAWACAVSMVSGMSDAQERVGGSMDGPDYRLWIIYEHRAPGRVRILSYWQGLAEGGGTLSPWPDDPAEPLVPGWAPFLSPSYEPPVHAFHHYVAQTFGWPCLSMWGAVKISRQYQWRPGSKPTVSTVFALELDPDKADDPNDHWDLRLLPLHPHWPGFVVNTIFFAAILWLLTLGPFTARRFIRRKRGLCIKCGYDLRGAEHEVCPECGVSCDGV